MCFSETNISQLSGLTSIMTVNLLFKIFCFTPLVFLFHSCNSNKPKPFSNWQEPITRIEFVLIPEGSFLMGNPSAERDTNNLESIHFVTLTQDFWLSKTEITQEQWQKVMGVRELHPDKPNPFRYDNSKYPVVSKSYYDVQNFLQKLETLSPGNHFRLPTEAEWEYACRANTYTNFSIGQKISDSLSNYNAEITSKYSIIGINVGHPTSVGSYSPNPWGLFDMHGNVWEWVSDWYAPYSSQQTVDPQGPQNGTLKVIRGGSWYFGADNARSYSRGTHSPQSWGFSIGFRIVREKIDFK